jgi:p-aminobenzoyl-glutamate transporter AbgT
MKKLENKYRSHIGWVMSAIWTPFLNHREMFGSNPIINFIIVIAIGVIIMIIGLWIADKVCEK